MTVGNPASDPAFAKLRELRSLLLKAHKQLMEAEKDAYEAIHGPIPHKGEYLRLVLSHDQFSWLRPISQFIVQMDGVLMAKEPQPLGRAEDLMVEARHLLQTTEIGHAFQEKSTLLAQRDAAMAALVERVTALLQG